MAAATKTVLYDVTDCKVYPMLTDVSGASATYGAAVDVPGISAAGINPNFVSAEIKGDGQIIDTKSKIDRFDGTFQHAQLELNVLKTILGGALYGLGSGGAEEARWDYSSGGMPHFKLEFAITDVDAGAGLAAVHAIVYKCTVTAGTVIDQKVDAYGVPSFTIQGIKPLGLTPMVTVRLLETDPGLEV